jgi:hypothetical protein
MNNYLVKVSEEVVKSGRIRVQGDRCWIGPSGDLTISNSESKKAPLCVAHGLWLAVFLIDEYGKPIGFDIPQLMIGSTEL